MHKASAMKREGLALLEPRVGQPIPNSIYVTVADDSNVLSKSYIFTGSTTKVYINPKVRS